MKCLGTSEDYDGKGKSPSVDEESRREKLIKIDPSSCD